MLNKPTDELNELLENAKPGELGEYIKENRRYLADDKKGFYYYFKDVLDLKNIKLKDVYSFAGVSESYGGQIIREEKPTKDRDLIIRLCVAGHFNLDEIIRSLKLYNMRELYSKDPRDACLIVAINNRIYDLGEIDVILTSNNFPKLTKDEQ